MSDNLKRTIIRFAIIFFGIMAMFIVVICRIVYIQTAEREQWEKLGNAKREASTRVARATRGNIYDEEERLLASSIPQYRMYMDTRVEALHLGGDTLFWQYVDSMAIGFSQIIGDKTASEYRSIMVNAFKQKRYALLT